MGLESATYISDLVSTNPVTGDGVNAGDDHLRLIKAALQATFPGATASLRQNFIHILSSASGTNTITASSLPEIASYTSPTLFVITPANTNTGATTLNVDSVGDLDVLNIDGSACGGGELVSGIPALLLLDSGADDLVIINPNVLKSRGLEVGARGLPISSQSGDYTMVQADGGTIVTYTGSGGHTFTLPLTLTGLPVIIIRNAGSGNLTIATSSGNLNWYNGSGTFSFTSRTLAVTGSCSANFNGTNWDITGAGLT